MASSLDHEDPQIVVERLRLILDGVRDHAITMLDPEGRVETFNVPAARIKGFALEEVRGQHFRVFFTAEDRASGLPELELETARIQGRYEGEGWRLRKDGSRFYASVSLSALQDSAGRLVGFVKVTQDRTPSRDLSDTLARREAEQRLIIDAIPGLVAYIDREHRYRLVSRAYEEWFKRPAAQIVGHHMSEVLGAEAYAKLKPFVDAAVSGHRTGFENEVPYSTGTRWIRAAYIPDIDETGQVLGLVTLVLDVTEAKAVERKLADEARVNETLYRVGTMLAGELDQATIFQRLTDEATALCRAQFGAFFYNVDDPQGGRYMLYTLSGVPRERFAQFPMPRNTAIFGPTFAGVGVVRADDITQDPRFGKSAPYNGMPAGHLPVVSYLAVPVVSRGGEVHGGLFFGHADKGVFTERDERMLVAVAAQAAVAIEHARLLEATTAAEAKYRAVAESSPQFIWTTSASGAIEYANSRFTDFVGFSLAELQAQPAWERVVHPADGARAAAIWAEAVTTGSTYEVEFRFRRGGDGGYRWFLSRGVPVRDEAGHILRWVGSSTDIDDRRRGEETQRFLAEAGVLLGSSLEYRAVLPSLARLAVPHMADWCVIDLLDDAGERLERAAVAHGDPTHGSQARTDRHRAALHDNPTLHRAVVSGRAEVVGEVSDAVLVSVAHEAQGRGAPVTSWMIVPITAHSHAMGVIAFATAESGRRFESRDVDVALEIGRRVGVMLDNARLFELTQQERRRAEEASRAKDELLSVTSHELRTPLNAIVGWSRLLRSGGLTPEKQARALETIERNANIQVQLVDDLLDFSRVMTGRLRLALAAIDPRQVVEAAVEVVRPAADAKGVRLQVVLEPSAGVVNADAARVQQVVWNLLSNAVKFTPRGGRVYVRMQRQDSAIELEVSDTGVGIDAAFLPHVFQPFRQQDASITRRHGGLGLGLAIAKHLIEQHGGTIEARSDGADKGATFVVRLPMAPLRAHPLTSSAPPPRDTRATLRGSGPLACPPELEGLFVLVCEDEPDARDLLESIITGCNAEVAVAGSVAEALDLFHRRIPDVLVSDIGMPDASGYDLIRRIRSLPPERGGRVPAVALTAYASLPDRTRALMEGFQNHVSKPTDPEELVAVVAALAGWAGKA